MGLGTTKHPTSWQVLIYCSILQAPETEKVPHPHTVLGGIRIELSVGSDGLIILDKLRRFCKLATC
jgi:hypothetical protein